MTIIAVTLEIYLIANFHIIEMSMHCSNDLCDVGTMGNIGFINAHTVEHDSVRSPISDQRRFTVNEIA